MRYPDMQVALNKLIKFYPTRAATARALGWPKSTLSVISSGKRKAACWQYYVAVLQLLEKHETKKARGYKDGSTG